ncbi:MAG: FG-GAP-like repeat-containing protein [Bacteroidota bacterium]
MLWSLAFSPRSFAQSPSLQPLDDIPFYIDSSQTLANPLTGGLAMPQFSNYDLDRDGMDDLLVFDRIGTKWLPFLKNPTTGEYKYAPQYESIFPKLTNFALLKDFDGDGIRDIFTSYSELGAQASILVYKGYEEDGRRWFENFEYNSGDPEEPILECHAFDIPAFEDINGDGDLDLMFFPTVGLHIYYYENQSIEMGYGLDSIIYQLTDNCWGRIAYGLNNIELDVCEDSIRSGGASSRTGVCLGSLLLAIDKDGDGDKDVLFSALTDTYLSLLLQDQARVYETDREFIVDDMGELPYFPAAFLVHINEDELPDLCVSSNRQAEVLSGSTEDRFLYFVNTGTAQQPSFELQDESFLVRQSLDEGFRSSIATLDYNHDGLTDIVIAGNYGNPFYTYKSSLVLYENIGTPSSPAYRLVDTDFGRLDQFNFKAIHPTFGDVDQDGDDDLLIGTYLGNLHYFENVAASNRAPIYRFIPSLLDDFKTSFYSRPQLVDLDGDGKKDVLLGSSNGPISWLKNESIPGSPSFSLKQENLGELYQGTFGIESCPFVFANPSGQGQSLLVGTKDGSIDYYPEFHTQAGVAYQLATPQYGGIQVGTAPTPHLADLNADGQLELLLGNERGGLNIYSQDISLSSQQTATDATAFAIIYPNPADDWIKIELKSGELENITISLVNSIGQKTLSLQNLHPTHKPINIDTRSLSPGIYVCNISTKNFQFSQKLLIR